MTALAGTSTIVCDVGTAWFRGGFGGSDTPAACVPALVGKQVFADDNHGSEQDAQDFLVGDGCIRAAQLQNVKTHRPVQAGLIQDWAGAVRLWDHLFQDCLHVESDKYKVLLTEAPVTSARQRHKLFELMFERYSFTAAFASSQAALSLYAQGLMTGLSVDAGEVTYVVPVVDGYCFPHLVRRLDVGGQQVTQYLLDLLRRRGYAFNSATDMRSLQHMKERVCYVACNYPREAQLARETTCVMQTYTLPDGRTIKVGPERFMAPEAMFNPRLIDQECEGLSEVICSCIRAMDIDNRMAMYQHIVLSGGSSMFGGLSNRLERDIKSLYVQHTLKGDQRGLRKLKVCVDDHPQRQNLVYLGAAVLAGIMQHDNAFWISKSDWQEDPWRALKRCGVC